MESTMTEKYHAVNEQWPEIMPVLTGEEAISAAKRLYRFAMKRAWKGKWALTSGRRYTWPRRGTFYVNPDRKNWSEASAGWQDLVHMMSHYCHRQLHPKRRPHDYRHHALEKEMVAYVMEHDWLSGKLKAPVKARPDPVATKAAGLEARAARWAAKLRRAETALRKITRQRAALARRARLQNGAEPAQLTAG
jgi:hypothetical protein